MAFPDGSDGKETSCNAGDLGLTMVEKDPMEKGMATHSSILACRILWTKEPHGLWTEEPVKLLSLRSQRVGHD